jgi:hypothetical protein
MCAIKQHVVSVHGKCLPTMLFYQKVHTFIRSDSVAYVHGATLGLGLHGRLDIGVEHT